jgi:nicotinamidase/pyrazinamidase
MKSESTIFYDVDTQRDFLDPNGACHLTGAELMIPRLKEITEFGREVGVRIVCALDRHQPGDPLLKSGNGELPDHCLVGTLGAEKIKETAPLKPLVIGDHELSPQEIRTLLEYKGELVFDRRKFETLAENAHAHTILRLVLQPFSDIVVYGVYLEVCVDRAIRELVGLGPKLHVVSDAIAIISGRNIDFIEKWKAEGIDVIDFADLKSKLLNQ